MKIRTYKIITIILTCLLIWLACEFCILNGKIMKASFVVLQGEHLHETIKAANLSMAGRDEVLINLDWYIHYYDHRTNDLSRFALYGLLQEDREDRIHETITYLRKNSTNDWGDDPYLWLKKEYIH